MSSKPCSASVPSRLGQKAALSTTKAPMPTPHQIVERRRRVQARRQELAVGRRSSIVVLVEAQEGALEVGLGQDQVADGGGRARAARSAPSTTPRASGPRTSRSRTPVTSRSCASGGGPANQAVNSWRAAVGAVDVATRHHGAGADDDDLVGDPLHVAQHVR